MYSSVVEIQIAWFLSVPKIELENSNFCRGCFVFISNSRKSLKPYSLLTEGKILSLKGYSNCGGRQTNWRKTVKSMKNHFNISLKKIMIQNLLMKENVKNHDPRSSINNWLLSIFWFSSFFFSFASLSFKLYSFEPFNNFFKTISAKSSIHQNLLLTLSFSYSLFNPPLPKKPLQIDPSLSWPPASYSHLSYQTYKLYSISVSK